MQSIYANLVTYQHPTIIDPLVEFKNAAVLRGTNANTSTASTNALMAYPTAFTLYYSGAPTQYPSSSLDLPLYTRPYRPTN